MSTVERRRPVLVAFDGRCPATLRAGATLARALGAPVTVASAYRYTPLTLGPRALPREAEVRRAEAAQLLVDTAVRAIPGLEVDTRVLPSTDVRTALLDLADELDAEALVLGPDLHGDVSRRVTGASPRPALMVPEHPGLVSEAYAEIGVAYDGSLACRSALDAAVVVAERTDATVHIVSVAGDADAQADLRLEAERVAVGLAARVDVTVDVRLGDPARRLRDAARGFDLLLCGRRRRARVVRALLGSVSAELLTLPTCPTLLVPPGAHLLESARPGHARATQTR